MADGFEVSGLGALDRLRAQASALGDEDLQGSAPLQPHGFPGDKEGPRERGPPGAGAPATGSKCLNQGLKSRKLACAVPLGLVAPHVPSELKV